MWQLVASVGVGCAVGYWLDKKFGWSPWALIGGSVLGMTAGMTAFLRAALNSTKAAAARAPEAPRSDTVFGRSALQFGLTSALAALAVPFVGSDLRTGFAFGVGTAALAGGLTLGFLALTSKKDGKQLLAGFVASFLLKMLLVAAGMLLAHVVGASLIGFSLGFFALLIVHQGLEILLVTRLAKVPKAEGRA